MDRDAEARLRYGRPDRRKVDRGAGNQSAELVREATGGEGFGTVFDATGTARAMESAFGYVAHGSALVINQRRDRTITPLSSVSQAGDVIGSRSTLRAISKPSSAAWKPGACRCSASSPITPTSPA